MELFSLLYLLFVGMLVFLYYFLPHCRKSLYPYQWCILLVGSIGYYLYMGKAHILFLLLTSFSVWAGGLLLSRQDMLYQAGKKELTDRNARKALKRKFQKRKQWILVLELLLNFGILAYLKYWQVIRDTLTSIAYANTASLQGSTLTQTAGLQQAATLVKTTGISASTAAAGILLPLGISFYTFQAISYLIDQYGGKYPAEKNYARFLLFSSWFPQLLEGPINRYDRLSSSLFAQHRWDGERAKRAMLRILYGLMKKYAIADMLSPSIGYIFDTGYTAERHGCMIVFGILLYSAQQYTDFSGGIDMVMGVSELFGVEMMPNFRQPYFSVSLGDFWRRWHISLGAWMRDYVFYPFALWKPMQRFGKWCTKHLGKHAGRTLPACIANILVFLIVGIWHGPESHYLLWGLYNGLVIAASDLTSPFWKRCGKALHFREESRGLHLFRILRTFFIVNIGWYFDRIYRFSDCMAALRNTFTSFHAGAFVEDVKTILVTSAGGTFNLAGSYLIALIGLCVVFVCSLETEQGKDVPAKIGASAVRTSLCAYGSLLLVFGSFIFTQAAGGFMYANF